jgi:hypothetical protein
LEQISTTALAENRDVDGRVDLVGRGQATVPKTGLFFHRPLRCYLAMAGLTIGLHLYEQLTLMGIKRDFVHGDHRPQVDCSNKLVEFAAISLPNHQRQDCSAIFFH